MPVKISVIITCYNLEKYISRAINSCLNQTMPDENYEVIVVDDASTDGSWDAIKQFNGLVKTVRHAANLGVSAASNAGIRAAAG